MTLEIYQPFLMSRLARRLDVRFVGAMQGRYALSNRPVAQQDISPVHACRLCSISTRCIVVVASEPVEVGDTVSAHFDHFGILRGKISTRLPSGFIMGIDLDEEGRVSLAAKIKWQKRRARTPEPDKRDYPRIRPRDPCTLLILADGSRMPCFVIDISQSGAAVSAAILPARGTLVAVGGLIGRVVRRLDVGFAVQFNDIHDAAHLERLMAPPREGPKTAILPVAADVVEEAEH